MQTTNEYKSQEFEVTIVDYENVVVLTVIYYVSNPSTAIMRLSHTYIRDGLKKMIELNPSKCKRMYMDLSSIKFLSAECKNAQTDFTKSLEEQGIRVESCYIVASFVAKTYIDFLNKMKNTTTPVYTFMERRKAWDAVIKVNS